MGLEKIVIPDFGDVQQITVVEVFVSPGDRVELEDPLIALESEKAVMDIPSPLAGVIAEVHVKADDIVGSGDLIVLLQSEEEQQQAEPAGTAEKVPDTAPEHAAAEEPVSKEPVPGLDGDDSAIVTVSHATPSVRALARQHDIDLSTIAGTGPRGRITKEDVLALLQEASSPSIAASDVSSAAEGDPELMQEFRKYGEVEEVALGRIQKISGPHLHKSWTSIPHVTHFDEADITEIERFRKELNRESGEGAIRYSPLVFVIRAVVSALKTFPLFNSSLSPGGSALVLKKYYNVAIAVDTEDGLLVPVIKNAESLGLEQIAVQLKELSGKARDGKLGIGELQGATFTISSLGGIGGTGFTPIVNSPQAAILGLSQHYMKPVWDGQQFTPRLTLPFSVSYDHRIIDGAEAARFCRALRLNLEDLKRSLL